MLASLPVGFTYQMAAEMCEAKNAKQSRVAKRCFISSDCILYKNLVDDIKVRAFLSAEKEGCVSGGGGCVSGKRIEN